MSAPGSYRSKSSASSRRKPRTDQQKVEIERLLQEAQEASRSKSEFLANMSHENPATPMNGVIGMTESCPWPLRSAPNSASTLAHPARLSANSLLTVLNDVLDFFKNRSRTAWT